MALIGDDVQELLFDDPQTFSSVSSEISSSNWIVYVSDSRKHIESNKITLFGCIFAKCSVNKYTKRVIVVFQKARESNEQCGYSFYKFFE